MTVQVKRLWALAVCCMAMSACIHPTKRVQIDECYELVREAMLIRTKCPAFMQDYMIVDEEDNSYSSGSCLDHIVDNLPAGEQIHFNEVIYQFQGSTGSCWRVFADLPQRQDIGGVEAPSCFPGLQTPSGWTTVEAGVVQVNPERLQKCSQ